MTLPLLLRAIRGMVWDTFRQSLASRLFWGMLAITLVAVVVCASIRVTGSDPSGVYEPDFRTTRQPGDDVRNVGGTISFGFGIYEAEHLRNRENQVRFIEIVLAGAAAGTVGVLLALLWTAGFLPNFLEPQSATVLLAKPTPRWAILLGKYLGVLLFVALQTALFIGGTFLALGFATGFWHFGYWLALPLLVLHFGVFYAVSAFLAVATRSTVVAAFGTLMVWLLCWTVNISWLQRQAGNVPGMSGTAQALHGTVYWVLPKPLEFEGIFYTAMRADNEVAKDEALKAAELAGTIHPELAVFTSMLFAALVLAAAAYEFRHLDY
jgi:ABC-type transport system involved in multi-copper enzyme maturation permease subunit